MINGTMVDKSGNFRVGGTAQPNASCSSTGNLSALSTVSFGNLSIGGPLIPSWQPHTPYAVGVYVLDTNYKVQECVIAGTSGPGPVWQDGLGQTTIDGSVTWTCLANTQGSQFYVDQNGNINIANSLSLASTMACNGGLIVTANSEFGAPSYITWSAGLSVQVFQQLSVGSGLTQAIWMCLIAGNTGGTEPSFSGSQGTQVVDGTVTWINIGPPNTTPVTTNLCTAATYASTKMGVTSPGLTVAFTFTGPTGAVISTAFVQGIMTYLALSNVGPAGPTNPSGGSPGSTIGGTRNQLINVTGQLTLNNVTTGSSPTPHVNFTYQITSSSSIQNPLQFLYNTLPSGATCTNATGVFAGEPYITLPGPGSFIPGEVLQVTFYYTGVSGVPPVHGQSCFIYSGNFSSQG